MKHLKTVSDRNRIEAGTRKTEENLAEIEYSNAEETSIDAFKRIRLNKWASDTREGQLISHLGLTHPDLTGIGSVDALDSPSQDHPEVSQILFF